MSSEENGFLTDRDKAFLQADGDYYTGDNAKHQRYETREVIAERARQAFHDFALLYDVLDEHERDRIFSPDVDNLEGDLDYDSQHTTLRGAIEDTFAFLYLALAAPESEKVSDRSMTRDFEDLLKVGVRKAAKRAHPGDNSNLFVSMNELEAEVKQFGQPRPRQLIERAATDPDSLSEAEVRTVLAMLATGSEISGIRAFDGDDPIEFFRERVADPAADNDSGD